MAPAAVTARTGRRTTLPPVLPTPAPTAAPARNARCPDALEDEAVRLCALREWRERSGPRRANEPRTPRPAATAGRAASTTTVRPPSERNNTRRASRVDESSAAAGGRPASGPASALPELGGGRCGWSDSFPERMRASPSLDSSGYVLHSSDRPRLPGCRWAAAAFANTSRRTREVDASASPIRRRCDVVTALMSANRQRRSDGHEPRQTKDVVVPHADTAVRDARRALEQASPGRRTPVCIAPCVFAIAADHPPRPCRSSAVAPDCDNRVGGMQPGGSAQPVVTYPWRGSRSRRTASSR